MHAFHVPICVLQLIRFNATFWTVARQAPPSMDSPGKNTGVGCHALLQVIFPTQGLNLHLLPVHPKGDQSWVFIGRNDAKAETPVL